LKIYEGGRYHYLHEVNTQVIGIKPAQENVSAAQIIDSERTAKGALAKHDAKVIVPSTENQFILFEVWACSHYVELMNTRR
jgi:hypothetical protein